MGKNKYKPITPGTRTRQINDFEEVTVSTPEKSLVKRLKKQAGRDSLGRISVRHRGGGSKRLYRKIDFKRDKKNVPGVVKTIEYDPNRSAFICLVVFSDGEKRYIIAPEKIKVGTKVFSGDNKDIQSGNAMKLRDIPVSTLIHNVELHKGKGAQLARSAGSSVVLMAKHEKYATVKLPSGEVRYIGLDCLATIGVVGNADHRNTVYGKAGAKRWKGRRPHVRGSVMNPCDHPHGGGEGRAPIGRSGPMTPWGKPTLGYKTRKPKNKSNKYILKKRR